MEKNMIPLISLHQPSGFQLLVGRVELGGSLRHLNFPGGSDGNAFVYNAGDPGSIPGLGRSPGDGNGSPLQYSCLENPMDGW